MQIIKPSIIKIPGSIDERGEISFFEINKEIDFAIKRIYYISKVPPNLTRGHHGHKKLKQFMIAINGSFEVELDDGKNKYSFILNNSKEGLYIPAGYYRVLKNFSSGAICLVCASEIYDKEDYIFDYQDFLKWKSA